MGTAQFEENPDSTAQSAELPFEAMQELPFDAQADDKKRLHLRDIANESLPEIETVGGELRKARMRRGENIDNIAHALRIRAGQLEALEQGTPEKLPGRAYAVGFIRSYAEYLGLDPVAVVARYKAELEGAQAAPSSEFTFPKIGNYRTLPRGTFLVVAVIIALGIYGAWLLVQSADRMVAERVPPVPAQITASATKLSDQSARGLSGDPASASTRAYEVIRPEQNPVYAVPPVTTPQTAEQAGIPQIQAGDPAAQAQAVPASAPLAAQTAGQTAMLPSGIDPSALSEAPAGIPANVAEPAALPPIQAGQAFGSENIDGRVVVRARKSDAWLRVENEKGKVLIERTLQLGDSYRVPSAAGIIMVARDASAFEIMVDGASLGLAGPPTLVLTGKPLEPTALQAASPLAASNAAPQAGLAQPAASVAAAGAEAGAAPASATASDAASGPASVQ